MSPPTLESMARARASAKARREEFDRRRAEQAGGRAEAAARVRRLSVAEDAHIRAGGCGIPTEETETFCWRRHGHDGSHWDDPARECPHHLQHDNGPIAAPGARVEFRVLLQGAEGPITHTVATWERACEVAGITGTVQYRTISPWTDCPPEGE